MKNVIANSQTHLTLERQGWTTVRVANGVATMVWRRNWERPLIPKDELAREIRDQEVMGPF